MSICSTGDRGRYLSRSFGEMEFLCRSSLRLMPLLLFTSSGRWSSDLGPSMANGWVGGVPGNAPGGNDGCGIPSGSGGAWPTGICWACICCNKRGKSGRCWNIQEREREYGVG